MAAVLSMPTILDSRLNWTQKPTRLTQGTCGYKSHMDQCKSFANNSKYFVGCMGIYRNQRWLTSYLWAEPLAWGLPANSLLWYHLEHLNHTSQGLPLRRQLEEGHVSHSALKTPSALDLEDSIVKGRVVLRIVKGRGAWRASVAADMREFSWSQAGVILERPCSPKR